MAAAPGNRWWESVLEWGEASPHAAAFDIDWSAPRLLLPILGTSFDDALRDGVLGVAFDGATGEIYITCYDRRLPLTPPSYRLLLARVDDDRAAELANSFAVSVFANAGVLKERLAHLAGEAGVREAIAAAVSAAGKDRDFLTRLHDVQVWRLDHWRLARKALTYRRFFEIADLICLRIEDAAVFAAVHARLLTLIREGKVDGIRIDHIDGLADPKEYLERLTPRGRRTALPPGREDPRGRRSLATRLAGRRHDGLRVHRCARHPVRRPPASGRNDPGLCRFRRRLAGLCRRGAGREAANPYRQPRC